LSQADVVLDGTMGGSGALAGPNFTIDTLNGRTIGTNLFHSFSEFNLTSSQSATFTNTTAAVISNVLGRITDTNASSIDGRIASTIPDANLFLMNPHGMMFGPNATLDVQGAFHATTADYIGLADGTRFNAIPSGADALLTTAAPSAFGFLGDNPGAITIDHSKLAVPQGQTLSLVGGDITITGTDLNTDNVSLITEGGTINLVSVASAGEATFTSPLNADGFTNYLPH
jgi:filamentous hemagglutinin family protein